jgi:hypothetical protein
MSQHSLLQIVCQRLKFCPTQYPWTALAGVLKANIKMTYFSDFENNKYVLVFEKYHLATFIQLWFHANCGEDDIRENQLKDVAHVVCCNCLHLC